MNLDLTRWSREIIFLNLNDLRIHCSKSLCTGSFNGGLSSLRADDLGAVAIKEALKRAKISGDDVSEVILGQVLTAGVLLSLSCCFDCPVVLF